MISAAFCTFTVGDSPVVPTTPSSPFPLDVPIDELAKACVVHVAIFKHGGDKGDDATCKGALEVVMSEAENAKGPF